ncbi:DUF4265 domain-containing protein [Longispora sp. K20-0274]|uniref:DUF4265 domain-containing protein n=1 Tax=Longispora sp. K20-0274 TaxID=3088255 RepID=UPI003999BD54
MSAAERTDDLVAAGFVKVLFALERDEDGWPPVSVEGLWARRSGPDLVVIDNVPWFVRDVACGDVFGIRTDADGQVWAEGKVTWSGRCTIRVIPWQDGPLAGDRQVVLDVFAPFGVTGEGVEQFGMVALDVPPEADLLTVRALLAAGEADGRWAFEEGCIGDAWAAIDT